MTEFMPYFCMLLLFLIVCVLLRQLSLQRQELERRATALQSMATIATRPVYNVDVTPPRYPSPEQIFGTNEEVEGAPR